MKTMKKFASLSTQERSKVVSESWSKLSTQQKQQYVDLAEEDKKRYKKEMTQFEKKGWYRDKDGNDSRKLANPKTKKTEDVEMTDESKKGGKKSSQSATAPETKVTKPKPAKSSYMFYMNEQYPISSKANPELKMVDITKLNTDKWKTLTDKQKAKYEKMNEADKVRHEKEMKQFNELGYFINSDGVKSTLIGRKGKVLEFEADVVTPKKPPSSYIFWGKEWHQKNKDSTLSSVEKIRKIAEEWNSMDQKQRAKFEAAQAKDQKRYEA